MVIRRKSEQMRVPQTGVYDFSMTTSKIVRAGSLSKIKVSITASVVECKWQNPDISYAKCRNFRFLFVQSPSH